MVHLLPVLMVMAAGANNAGSAMGTVVLMMFATGIVATAIGQRPQALANGAVALGGDAQAKKVLP